MNVVRSYVSPTRQGGPAKPRTAGHTAEPHSADDVLFRLTVTFALWRLLLFAVVSCSPGPHYDTSTRILLDHFASGTTPPPTSWLTSGLERLALVLTRWDGIYFATASHRGHVYEQEWAFSWLLSKATSALARVLLLPASLNPVARHALAGVLLSTLAHFLSVLVLYRLVRDILPASEAVKRRLATTTATLHILSPAGVFLSAPYGESTFALCNFAGLLSYAYAVKFRHSTIPDSGSIDAFYTVVSGLCFGLAALARSNGLLSGILFAWDALALLPELPRLLRSPDGLVRLAGVGLGGLLTAAGFAIPQIVAYREYCVAGATGRPWCSSFPPSIYSFVQREYWGVGFLRYWTLNNLPLFLLAIPMLSLLIATALVGLFDVPSLLEATAIESAEGKRAFSDRELALAERASKHVLQRLALLQLTLAILAATSFHVQIINRISSGYPLWYLVVAVAIHARDPRRATPTPSPRRGSGAFYYMTSLNLEWVVRAAVMYALVQAALYASFLPPA